ncbi:MAG: Crp/Fnr family transcriptional regulator [Chloroflexota bacterium]
MVTTNTQTEISHYIDKFKMADFLNEAMLTQLEYTEVPVYQHVYKLGDKQTHLYFLVEGELQCYHYHLNGKLAVFGLSHPFTAIGELEILKQEPIHSNVIATQRTALLGISKAVVDEHGKHDSRFLHFIIEQLTNKLYTSNTLHKNTLLPLKHRLVLYILANTNTPSTAFTLPAKEGFASLLGTTTRHLNRVLRELITDGAISDGYPLVRILDRVMLEAMIEG